VHWASTGIKLSLATNLVLNWVCLVLSFRERFQPITAAAMCTLTIHVLEPGAFNLSISYPYLIKFHYFANNSQEGIKHQMRGATQAQQGMTLGITLLCVLNTEFQHFILRFLKNSLLFVDTTERGVGGWKEAQRLITLLCEFAFN